MGRSRKVLRTFVLAVASWTATAVGCASAPPPVPAQPTLAVANEHFAQGRFQAAADAFVQERERATDDEGRAYATLMLALSIAAQGPSEHVLDDLRELATSAPHTRWGRIAALVADEMVRSHVLLEAVISSGYAAREEERRASALRERVAELETQLVETDTALTGVREELARARAQLREAEAKRAEHLARIQVLEEELTALKRIDMERQP